MPVHYLLTSFLGRPGQARGPACCRAAPSGGRARRHCGNAGYDFYSKLGMNTQLHFGYQTPSSVIAELGYLGVKQVRDSLFVAGDIPGFEALMAAGIKAHLELQGWVVPAPPAATWLGWIEQMLNGYPGMITGVSGPNQVDNVGCAFVYGTQCGIPAANQAQMDIYNGVKGTPQLEEYPR